MTLTIIDGKNQILGRMASRVAKRLLTGESVALVNCEHILVSGDYQQYREKAFIKLERGPKGNPEKGPHYSRMPDRYVKSVIRTMLPKKSKRGEDALKRLRVYISIPKTLEGKEMEQRAENVSTKTFTIGKLCKGLGANW